MLELLSVKGHLEKDECIPEYIIFSIWKIQKESQASFNFYCNLEVHVTQAAEKKAQLLRN